MDSFSRQTRHGTSDRENASESWHSGKLQHKRNFKPSAESVRSALFPRLHRNPWKMKFGLWFEPEMVSEDSKLYRKHPEWAIKIPSRNPVRSRYQLVLDMTNPEVREYLFDTISKVLNSANISYVKWDMNRSICYWYTPCLSSARQGEMPHRYVLGLYELLERLTTAFPDILEGCSGGGGRFDAGMLYYCPQIWCSDDTDAYERTKIQYSTSFFYPVSAVGSHDCVDCCRKLITDLRKTAVFTAEPHL